MATGLSVHLGLLPLYRIGEVVGVVCLVDVTDYVSRVDELARYVDAEFVRFHVFVFLTFN